MCIFVMYSENMGIQGVCVCVCVGGGGKGAGATILTLVLLKPNMPYIANYIDQDQLASEEPN